MAMERDTVVQVLLRERLRIAAAAVAVVRDAHAADDIFQQLVVMALGEGRRFEGPGHVLAWAVRAARHRAVDLARRRRLRSLPNEVLDLLEAAWADPVPSGWSDRAEALCRCVGRLAPANRELLRMKYADGLTAPAIAERQRRTADAVYQNLSRVHRCLRECVERELEKLDQPASGGVS
jgi:RNA polymerase sigma factor (sigma-70 family)